MINSPIPYWCLAKKCAIFIIGLYINRIPLLYWRDSLEDKMDCKTETQEGRKLVWLF